MSIDQMYLKTIVNYDDKNTGEFTSSVVRGGNEGNSRPKAWVFEHQGICANHH